MDDKIQATLPDEVRAVGERVGRCIVTLFYQTGRFSPQKVLAESQIDENFKQLFRQLAGAVRGGRERRRGGRGGTPHVFSLP